VDPVSRLERSVEERLADLDTLFGRAGVRYALIGATALLLQGIVLPRTTRDLDFAVSVGHSIDEVRTLFEAHGLRSSTTVRHRFIAEEGLEIDVLPIRGGTWADRVELPGGESISQAGLAEAIESAESIRLPTGSAFVAPLSVLVAVKLHVATVRSDERDLGDACAVLTQYESVRARRFAVDYIKEGDLSWDTAGAWLAGRDAHGILDRESRTAVLASVEQLLGDVRLSDRFAGGNEDRDLLSAFRVGLSRAA
jgi:predicted nucleotidyltransferase